MKIVKLKYLLLLAMGCIIFSTKVSSQNTKQDVIAEIKRLQQKYSQEGSLTFDLKYLYYSESAPQIHLDSVNGYMTIQGTNYKLKLDSTETIRNDKYTIHLFGEDKVMYVSKSLGTQKESETLDYLSDKSINDTAILKWEVKYSGDFKIISIDFSELSPNKRTEFLIDKVSGYLLKVKNVVRTETLIDKSLFEADAIEQSEKYSIIEVMYSNYRKGAFEPEAFNEKNFFTRDGKEFIVTEKYKSYNIFLASPNL